MTDEQRAGLKRLAGAATPGPWFVGDWFGRCRIDHKHGGPECRYTYDNPAEGYRPEGTGISSREPGRIVVRSGYDGAEIDEPDARFIAAANPAAVLDLLAENERLSEDLVLERRMHKAALDENEQLWTERDRAESDNAALLAVLRRAAKAWAKVTTCRLGVAAARDDIDPITRVREEAHPGAALLAERESMLAENDRLRADMERLKAEIQRMKDEADETSLLAMEREEAKDVL